MAKCKYCQSEITWIKEGYKNIPIESDGGVHECSERKNALESYKKLSVQNISPEDIQKYEQRINQKVEKALPKKGKLASQ